MYDIPVLEVDDEIEKAMNSLAERNFENMNILRVKPPADRSDGMDAAGDFLESVHFMDRSRRMLLFEKNTSPVCGMEMWYDDNIVKFMFYTPSDTMEDEYRQQINGYYDGCEIADQTPNEGMFIPAGIGENEAVAVTDFHLNKHHFSPISNPEAEDNEIDDDPYQRIINEIDTKDDTRVMIQVLYKPAPYNWTENQNETLETYAKKVQNKGGFKTKWFGLKIEDVDDPGIYESAASEMRSRINKPSYYVNVRMAVVCTGQTQEKANQRAKSRSNAIANTVERLYETRVEQRLVPRKYSVNRQRNARETLVNMIERKPVHMSESGTIRRYIWQKLTPNHDKIVLTARELAGLVHLPSDDDVTTSSIEWTSEMVDGSVPPDVDEFEPVDAEEQTGVEEEGIELSNEDDEEETSDGEEGQQSVLFDN